MARHERIAKQCAEVFGWWLGVGVGVVEVVEGACGFECGEHLLNSVGHGPKAVCGWMLEYGTACS